MGGFSINVNERITEWEWKEKKFSDSKSSDIDNIYRSIWPGVTIKRAKKGTNRPFNNYNRNRDIFSSLKLLIKSNDINGVDNIIEFLKDKEMGIDSTLTLHGRTPITFQEKTRDTDTNPFLLEQLRKGCPSYDFPMEYMDRPGKPSNVFGNGRREPLLGSYFRCISQFYMVFYPYPHPYDRWYILDGAVFRIFVDNNKGKFVPGRVKKVNNGGEATWFDIRLEDLIKKCPECVMYDSFKKLPHNKFEVFPYR